MTSREYRSFKDFYPFYLTQHNSKINIALHFIGTLLVVFLLIYSILSKNGYFLLLIPIFGYGFAWVGHFFFQKNKPATFKYPIWSLFADFLMFYHVLTLQIEDQLEAALKSIK